MLKVSELAEKYGDYEVDEEKLKEFLTPPKPRTVWELIFGDTYYWFNSQGIIYEDTWEDDEFDISRRAIGNCFLTKEEAEFEIERRKVEAVLLKYGRREFKYGKRNYYFFYDHEDKLIRKTIVDCCQSQGIIFFETEELCQKAIEETGEDNIKKYNFGVVN